MVRLGCMLTLVSSLCGVLFLAPFVVARDTSSKSLSARRLEAVHRWELSARDRTGEDKARRATDAPAPPRVKNITFSNAKATRAYTGIESLCVAHLMLFQISTSMARQFLWSTLMSVRHGRA